ncbi:MAG: hypothetical protein LBM98_03020 [Oscillospiraceae bacterium]|nr:hypothetical protein [Oscillospiraceae bacterium]
MAVFVHCRVPIHVTGFAYAREQGFALPQFPAHGAGRAGLKPAPTS